MLAVIGILIGIVLLGTVLYVVSNKVIREGDRKV